MQEIENPDQAASSAKKSFVRKWGAQLLFVAAIIGVLLGFRIWTQRQADAPVIEAYRQYLDQLAASSAAANEIRNGYFSRYSRDTVASRHFESLCGAMTEAAEFEGVDAGQFSQDIARGCRDIAKYGPPTGDLYVPGDKNDAGAPAVAAASGWDDLYEQGVDAYNRGEYAAARAKLEPALAGALHDRSASAKTRAAVTDWLAMTERSLANYAAAEALFRRELPLNASAHGKNSLDYAGNLLDLEQTLAELGRDGERAPLIEEANAILARLPPSDESDRKRSWALHELGNLRYNQDRDKEAEDLWQRALAIRLRQKNMAAAATTLTNLGTLVSNDPARGKEALDFYDRALAIREAKDPNSDDVGYILLRIAKHKRDEGAKGVEIIALYRRALTIYERAYGSDNQQLIKPLSGLSAALEDTHQYQEAIALRLRLLAWIEKHGDDDDAASAHRYLARDYAEIGDKVKAQQHQDRYLTLSGEKKPD